jgi:hypothetical protein
VRLLDTTTLRFVEYHAPPTTDLDGTSYATLSHRWSDSEVSFEEYCLIQDYEDGFLPPQQKRRVDEIRNRTGYPKIMNFCNIARAGGYPLGWIDTCCIDKRSSAELSEAINSMWKFYETSGACYAYLQDVSPLSAGWARVGNGIETSEWFRRDWTLQELLAPSHVHFLTQDWELISTMTREKHSSKMGISEVLVGRGHVRHQTCGFARQSNTQKWAGHVGSSWSARCRKDELGISKEDHKD